MHTETWGHTSRKVSHWRMTCARNSSTYWYWLAVSFTLTITPVWLNQYFPIRWAQDLLSADTEHFLWSWRHQTWVSHGRDLIHVADEPPLCFTESSVTGTHVVQSSVASPETKGGLVPQGHTHTWAQMAGLASVGELWDNIKQFVKFQDPWPWDWKLAGHQVVLLTKRIVIGWHPNYPGFKQREKLVKGVWR